MRPERSTAYLALAGVLTGVAGVVTSQATVWALRASNPPVVAVASAVRDFTPGWLAHRLIELVGHLDKPLLVTGTVVILVLVCAATGLLSARHPLIPDLVFFALAVIGLAAVVRLEDSGIASGLAVVVGLVTWIVTLRFLTAPLLAEQPAGTPDDIASSAALPGSTRRAFLTRAGGVALVVAFAGAAGRYAGRSRRHVEQARRLLRLPVTRGTAPAGADLKVSGIEPWRTPNDDFYLIHTALAAPSIRPKDWQLRIHGMVDRELTVSYDDLVGRRLTEAWVTLCCVSNEVGGDLIGNAWWSGVLVRELLAEAGVSGDADAVLQTSRDGWTCGTPLAALTDDRNALLAIAMNGEPLPIDHGFPVRMVVPGLYGYVSATKWLVDLEVSRFDKFDAYWTERGWSERGPVKTQSRIDVPRNGSGVKAGTVRVGGSAWAQRTGIEKVQFQIDGGPWREAQLGGVPDLDTWVQWTGTVEVEPGKHVLVVRATDKSGYTQTSVRTDVVPDGATGWHSVSSTRTETPYAAGMHQDFADRAGAALVVGGSGGIGRAIVRMLGERGSAVVATYNSSPGKARAAVAEATAHGVRGEAVRMDLRDDAACAIAVRHVVAGYGGLHTLVYAAGPHVSMRHLSTVAPADVAEQLDADAAAFFRVASPALPALREAAGAIVAVTTAATARFPVRDGLSSVPKAAVEALVRGLAAEEGRFGVRVNCVGPGMLTDGMASRLIGSGELGERALEVARSNIPLHRFGQAVDIAEAVCFLASDRAGFITGQKLDVDGGYGV